MKRFLALLALLLVFSISLNAQISRTKVVEPELIGKVGAMGGRQFVLEKMGEEYTLTYQDAKFQHLVEYKTFSFKDEDGALDYLYDTMMAGLEKIPDEDVAFDVPGGTVLLVYTKMLGTTNVRFVHTDDATGVTGESSWLTKKKLRRLFGRKK